jgi:hypothetical protein
MLYPFTAIKASKQKRICSARLLKLRQSQGSYKLLLHVVIVKSVKEDISLAFTACQAALAVVVIVIVAPVVAVVVLVGSLQYFRNKQP